MAIRCVYCGPTPFNPVHTRALSFPSKSSDLGLCVLPPLSHLPSRPRFERARPIYLTSLPFHTLCLSYPSSPFPPPTPLTSSTLSHFPTLFRINSSTSPLHFANPLYPPLIRSRTSSHLPTGNYAGKPGTLPHSLHHSAVCALDLVA